MPIGTPARRARALILQRIASKDKASTTLIDSRENRRLWFESRALFHAQQVGIPSIMVIRFAMFGKGVNVICNLFDTRELVEVKPKIMHHL